MKTLKQTAITAIAKLPDTASINDIMTALEAIRLEMVHDNAKQPVSFLEVASHYAGCIKTAPADLSINKAYLDSLPYINPRSTKETL